MRNTSNTVRGRKPKRNVDKNDENHHDHTLSTHIANAAPTRISRGGALVEVEHLSSDQVVQQVVERRNGQHAKNEAAEAEKKECSNLPCCKKPNLLSFENAPSWLQDNHDIHSGYRPAMYSYRRVAMSLFYLHNETGNVYSHLLGAALFLALGLYAAIYILPLYQTVIWSDVAVIYIFMAGAVLCLSCSSYFHLMSCHSEPVCRILNKCDYVGIVLLIVGSFYPAIYYGFYCNSFFKYVYLSAITGFGASTIFVSASQRFQTPEFRWMRAGLFLALGCSGIFPITHGLLLYGWPLAVEATSLKFLLSMAAFYIAGAFIYASRVPERWFPGKFDYWFHSHQIFHYFVVIAATIHFLGIMRTFQYWHDNNHSCHIDVAEMMI